MKVIPVSKVFEVYGGVGHVQFERLDVAALNGFVPLDDNTGLLSDPHVLIVRCNDATIDNNPLGTDEEKIMVFAGEDAAYKFQEQFIDLFATRFWACLA